MKHFFLFILAVLFIPELNAQNTRYIVRLKNKGGTGFTLANASNYLSTRAISRRTRYSIAIDSSDLPVPAVYISQLAGIPNVTVLNVSRWLNAVTVLTTDPNALTGINALPFVLTTKNIAAKIVSSPMNKSEDEAGNSLFGMARTKEIEADYFDYGATAYNEIHLNNGEFLHNIGLRGQGMQIAMLDGGFFNYTSLRSFDSINLNGQVLGTWDFVNRETSVTEDITHGMQCLSTIAANIPGQFVGKAPKASFYLFRTEDASQEYPIEEFNWVCGAEKADSSGVDIISSSLGYHDFDNPVFNYAYADLNGHTTVAAIGASIAVRKGILVFNAAGNDGSTPWKYISTPADADSVLAVGAVNASGTPGNFSSYGPSGDGQVKPDIAAVGVNAVVQNANNSIGTNNGTSFACPSMAGMGTCLWQGFPEYNNMKIVRALRQAGSLAATPNDRIGYGIPDMKLAFSNLLKEFAVSAATVGSCKATINWTSKDVGAMKYEIERKAPSDADYIKIATIDALPGNILSNHTYSYENTITNTGAVTVSYRIRQIIDTVAVSFTAVYIDTAAAVFSTACTPTATGNTDLPLSKLYIAPNPTENESSLVIDTPGAIANMPISIYDMKGRLVLQLLRSKGTGKTVIALPSAKLPAGRYIIKVYNKQKPLGSTALIKL